MRANPFLGQPRTANRKEQIEKMQGEYSDRAYTIVMNQLIDNNLSISQEILFILLFGSSKAINIRI